jgi:hypothetical protein
LAVALVARLLLHSEQKKLTFQGIMRTPNETGQHGPWSWWLARAFMLNHPVDVVILGDSQVNAAIFQADAHATSEPIECLRDHQAFSIRKDLKELGLSGVRALNLATPGSFASDQYFLSEALFPIAPPKVVIVGVSPRFFLDSTLPSASATDSFKFFSPYVDLSPVADITFANPLEKFDSSLRNNLPTDQLHDSIVTALTVNVAKVLPLKTVPQTTTKEGTEPLNAVLNAEGDMTPGKAVIRPNETPPFRDNTAEYVHRYSHISFEQLFNQEKFLSLFLMRQAQRGTKVIVVGMPSLKMSRDLLAQPFWLSFKKTLSDSCAANGAVWYDLIDDPRFTNDCYLDTVHLNPKGGELFAQSISKKLYETGFLTKAKSP